VKRGLTSAQLAMVAERFKVLAEPARLQLLQALMPGELSVGQLVKMTGLTQANVSKHLQLLLAHNLVARRKEGLFVYYHIADRSVFQLCELVCSRLERESRERQRRLVRR
jgi:DNA-binding transcriptional ArsR family regulator